MFLSVVIPAYNEEKTIAQVIETHLTLLREYPDWEMICLDDASTDKTLDILISFSSKVPRIKLLSNAQNQGISRSFKRLFDEATGDYIYLTAADGQWPAENLRRLLMEHERSGADVIVGIRQKREEVYDSWRQMLSYGFNALAKSVLKMDIQDVNGIKMGRKDFFKFEVRSKSFFAEIERLAIAQEHKYKIATVPVLFVPRAHGTSKGAGLGNIAETIKDAIAYFTRKKAGRH